MVYFFFIRRYLSAIPCRGSERGPAKPKRMAPIIANQKKIGEAYPQAMPTKPTINRTNPPKNAMKTPLSYTLNFVVHFIFDNTRPYYYFAF